MLHFPENLQNMISPCHISRSTWGSASSLPLQQHQPVRNTIHHEGTTHESKDDAAAKIKAMQKWGMGPDRKWADIPYHLLIAPDGTIYEGRDIFTVGETNTEYNPSGHLLITCLGNLEVQEVTEAQLNSLIKSIAWSCKKYNIYPTLLPLAATILHKQHVREKIFINIFKMDILKMK
jgi:hypothetical protein